MVPFDGGLRCDRAIFNHSAAICCRMSPTLKSTGVQFGAKFWEKLLLDRCDPNFIAIYESFGALVCKKKSFRCLLPFEHNVRT